MATGSCATCMYGHQAAPARPDPYGQRDPQTQQVYTLPAVWQCRRHPPVPSTKPRPDYFARGTPRVGEYRPRGVFPEVEAGDWCGHHAPADDAEDRGR